MESIVDINLEHLRVFITASRIKDLRLAEIKLKKDKTNIIRIMRKVEIEFDLKLFNVKSHQILLTKDGEILIEDYGPAIDSFQETTKKALKLMNTNVVKKKVLKIGILNNLDINIIDKMVIKFAKENNCSLIINKINLNEFTSARDFSENDLLLIETKFLHHTESQKTYDNDFELELCFAYNKELFKESINNINDLNKYELVIPETLEDIFYKIYGGFKKLSIDSKVQNCSTAINFIKEVPKIALVYKNMAKEANLEILPITNHKKMTLCNFRKTPISKEFLNFIKNEEF